MNYKDRTENLGTPIAGLAPMDLTAFIHGFFYYEFFFYIKLVKLVLEKENENYVSCIRPPAMVDFGSP